MLADIVANPATGRHHETPFPPFLLFADCRTGALVVCNAAAQNLQALAIGTAEVAAVRDGRTLYSRRPRTAPRGHRSRRRHSALAGSDRRTAAAAGTARAGQRPLRAPCRFRLRRDAAQSLQQTMLEHGQARVSARVGDKACATRFARRTRGPGGKARALGQPQFRPFAGRQCDRTRAERGRFVLVEGKVLSVRESGGTIYVNFARRWTRDSPSSSLDVRSAPSPRRHRTESARGPAHPRARMDRAARRPDHRSRGAGADRIIH